jgi:hypothetical protein
MNSTNVEKRDCGACETTGKKYGRVCDICGGAGRVAEPDYSAIIALITTARGANNGKRRVYSSYPKALMQTRFTNPIHGAAYYVWRMARFAGGVDVTMPFTATIVLRGHPWQRELDAFADEFAKRAYGTDRAGALRWAGAFGHDVTEALQDPALPPTAFPGGPEKMKG